MQNSGRIFLPFLNKEQKLIEHRPQDSIMKKSRGIDPISFIQGSIPLTLFPVYLGSCFSIASLN